MNKILNILHGDSDEQPINIELEKKEKKEKKINSLDIKPVIKVPDDYSEPPNPNLLRLPFSLLEIAPKGSGKTTLLHNLIMWYYPFFDSILIFSPTINMDIKWKKLVEELQIPDENLFDKYKEDEVSAIMKQIKQENNKFDKNKDKLKILMIFDDCVDFLPKNRKMCALNRLAMNHRHYNISHIIISQVFKKLDPVLRKNTTGFIFFNVDNIMERKAIFEECCGRMGFRQFEIFYNYATKEKYNFLYINYDTRELFKNFDEKICNLDDYGLNISDSLCK